MSQVIDLKKIPPEQIVGRECKHVSYTESRANDDDDLLTVKELVYVKQGDEIITVPNLTFIKNYKRPFWITKEKFRDHVDKKEVEYVDKLKECQTTQRALGKSIVKQLGYGNPQQQLRVINRSPFVYGADVTPQTLVKRKYKEKWPGLFTTNKVAVLDTETDMWKGNGKDVIISTVTMKDKVILTILDTWIADIPDPINTIQKAVTKHLKKYLDERKMVVEIEILKSPGAMIKRCIDKCHEWQPEFVVAWNMDFDITVAIRALEAEGYDLPSVFSDPRVPEEFKHFRYKQGPTSKVKADGTVENLPPSDRWNVVEAPASFVWIDPMCVYRNIRRAAGKEPSYSLDYTLKRNLGEEFGKLYFDTGDSSAVNGSVEWHMQMQKHYKVNYVVYNIFDCLGVELLDEKTTDLGTQISILSESSEYTVFNSNPKRNVNEFYFSMLPNGLIAGTCSDRMEDENDKALLGKEGWIVTLPTHNVVPNGVYLIKELPNVRSGVRKAVSDADIGSTYPNGEILMNLSKMTTMMELCRVDGVLPSNQRLLGVNLTGGPVNAIEIMTSVMKAPNSFDLLEAFQAELREDQLRSVSVV
jgi:hypothetical protein